MQLIFTFIYIYIYITYSKSNISVLVSTLTISTARQWIIDDGTSTVAFLKVIPVYNVIEH